jgi:hypothetical protein
MTTQDPPNGWQLDKDISLLRKDLLHVQDEQTRQGSVQEDHGRILRELRDHIMARENQGRGIVWAAGLCGGMVSLLIGWAKTMFWTGGHH